MGHATSGDSYEKIQKEDKNNDFEIDSNPYTRMTACWRFEKKTLGKTESDIKPSL